jgi:MFS family permease
VFLDSIVYFALLPRLPFYAHEFSLSKAETGLLYGTYPLLSAASSLPAGALADRLGPRAMLAGGLGVLILASIGFAVADHSWELWAARALQGLGAGVTAPVGMAVIAASAGTGQLGSTLGLAVSIQSIASVGGPLLGGLAVPVLGLRIAFGVPAAIAALALAWVLLDASAFRATGPVAAGGGRNAALRDRNVRAGAGMFLAVGAVGAGVEVVALLALHADGVGSVGLGGLLTVGAAIGLVAALAVGRLTDRHGTAVMIRGWTALMVGLTCAFAISTASSALAALLLVVWVAQIPAGGTLAYAQASQGRTLGSGLGTGYGLSVMAWSVGAAVGPVLIGATAGARSDELAYAVAAALGLVLVLPALVLGARARHKASSGASDRIPRGPTLAQDDPHIAMSDDARVDRRISGVDE